MRINVVDSSRSRPEGALNDLWQQIQRARSDNEQLRESLQLLVERYRAEISPVERELLLPAKLALIKKLARFCERKSLGKSYRYHLIDWVHDELDWVMAVDLECGQQLADEFNRSIETLLHAGSPPIEPQAAALDSAIDGLRQAVYGAENLDEAQAAFGQFAEQVRRDQDTLDVPLFSDGELDAWLARMESEFIEAVEESMASAEPDVEDDQADEPEPYTDDLFGWDADLGFDPDSDACPSSDPELAGEAVFSDHWFKDLFRRAARALHPDREPDEKLRVQKQEIMANLLAARDAQDLATILSIYMEHVGDGELSVNYNNSRQLEHILRQQLQALEEDREDIISVSPLHYRVHNILYGKSAAKLSRTLAEIKQDIQGEAHSTLALGVDLKNLTILKEVLRARESYFFSDY